MWKNRGVLKFLPEHGSSIKKKQTNNHIAIACNLLLVTEKETLLHALSHQHEPGTMIETKLN